MSVARNGQAAQVPTELISQATRLTAGGLRIGVAEELLGVDAGGLSKIKFQHRTLWKKSEQQWQRASKKGEDTLKDLCRVLNDERSWNAGRKSETRDNVILGAFLTAVTRSKHRAASLLGLDDGHLYYYESRYLEWKHLLSLAEKAIRLARAHGDLPKDDDPGSAEDENVPRKIWYELWQVVAIVALECVTEPVAAKRVGVSFSTYWKHREKYRHTFDRICELQGLGVSEDDESATLALRDRARRRKAALIFVSGHSLTEAQRRLPTPGTKKGKQKPAKEKCNGSSVCYYKGRRGAPSKYWARLVEEARQSLLIPNGMAEIARLVFGSEATVQRRGRNDRPRTFPNLVRNLAGISKLTGRRGKRGGVRKRTRALMRKVIRRGHTADPTVSNATLLATYTRLRQDAIDAGKIKPDDAVEPDLATIRRERSAMGLRRASETRPSGRAR